MEKLSLLEFKNRCNDFCFRTFIFSTDNQSPKSIDSTVRSELTFKDMTITFNPNTICLRNKHNFLQLNKVKAVNLHKKSCPLGKVFTIICGDLNSNLHDRKYTLVAR